jgi:hypothetical protein
LWYNPVTKKISKGIEGNIMKYRVVVDYNNKDSIMYGTQDLILVTESESEAKEATEIMNIHHYDCMASSSYEEIEEINPEFKTVGELRKYFLGVH